MSAAEQRRVEWLDPGLWERLDSLEGRHRQLQQRYEQVRRGLECLTPQDSERLRQAWQCYCEVIADLDRATAEFEALRTCAG